MIPALLNDIQKNLYDRAKKRMDDSTRLVNSWDEFKEEIENGGFLVAHWDGTPETEQQIKEETKATIRFIPINSYFEDGKCIFSGKPSKQRVFFARAY
jgi:prolyl-tRNA synthetase